MNKYKLQLLYMGSAALIAVHVTIELLYLHDPVVIQVSWIALTLTLDVQGFATLVSLQDCADNSYLYQSVSIDIDNTVICIHT